MYHEQFDNKNDNSIFLLLVNNSSLISIYFGKNLTN
jgi:hypothetical protein